MNTAAFQKRIRAFYRRNKRDFPWRRTRDPYLVLVSEMMLQQTQADRVVPYYRDFLRRFPTFDALAAATLRDILRAWSGLGYNRRALYLKRAAEIVMRDHRGRLPRNPNVLRRLPGVGPYTAAAVACFAFNQPTVFIETNIRTVFIHHFFPRRSRVADAQLLPLVRTTLDVRHPREWYWALMDYGAHLKKTLPINPNRRSIHYIRQTPFRGSLREARGAVLRVLTTTKRLDKIKKSFGRTRIAEAIQTLRHDGLLP